MNTFMNLFDLWKEHYIIGSIIGILAVAFICEIYRLPFMINYYLSSKQEELKHKKETDGQLTDIRWYNIEKFMEACSNNMKVEQINLETLIHLFALQCSTQDSFYRCESEEYNKKSEEIHELLLEIFKQDRNKK